MTSNASESRARLETKDCANGALLEKFSTVHVVRSINAERLRVFQALTLPEYMEAWLTMPGASPGCATVTAGRNTLSIRSGAREADQITIQCSYKVCKRSRLLLDWEYKAMSSASLSLVDIRLLGDFERTTLELIHFGLHESVMCWHREFWATSFAQLSRLF